MTMTGYQDHTALIESFTEALSIMTGHPVSPEQSGEPLWDALLEAKIDDRPVRILVQLKRSVFPRDAREAAWRMRDISSRQLQNLPTISVLVAETISPGARDLLRQERIGYFDESGSLFLVADGIFIRIDKPRSKRQGRSLNNVFAGKRAQALHAIWLLGQEWVGVHQIAERALISPATASETLIALERREWVEVRGSGPAKERRLINPRALLDAWSVYQSQAKPLPTRHYYVRSTPLPVLQRKLDTVCAAHGVLYEITGLVAGQIHAPHLSSVSQLTCRLSNDGLTGKVLEALEAKPVREGWNLGVVEARFRDELMFHQRIDDLWVADPLQTYLDLLQAGGRAKELAQHLRAEKMGA